MSGGFTHLGFKEGLGSFDALRGHVDFEEPGQRAQPAVRQLARCRLPEDEQELGQTEGAEDQNLPTDLPTEVLVRGQPSPL